MIELLKQSLDYIVFGILGSMSFLMVWFAIERILYYRSVKLSDFSREDALNISLTKHLTLISTIGANAPYVGLLGTVIGILITFYDIGQSGDSIEVGVILVGLALALKATAMGLLVAIPAIWIYNGLLRRAEVLQTGWRTLHDKS
ncbi:MAG: TonB-system energizer ExbB [Gammaproteobacteria bacterium]|nr:TonB-system energizer ExbB [Gammaproteobacteria bacterium]MDH3466055.1 TonB-system energizer ExbB [Gammaproteobacteria bacterium]